MHHKFLVLTVKKTVKIGAHLRKEVIAKLKPGYHVFGPPGRPTRVWQEHKTVIALRWYSAPIGLQQAARSLVARDFETIHLLHRLYVMLHQLQQPRQLPWSSRMGDIMLTRCFCHVRRFTDVWFLIIWWYITRPWAPFQLIWHLQDLFSSKCAPQRARRD